MASKPNYPVYQLDTCELVLSDNPLDDYQRSYFATLSSGNQKVGETVGGESVSAGVQLLRDTQEDLHIVRSRYRTSAVQGFHDVLGEAGAHSRDRLPKKHNALECSEYQLPDVLRSQSRQAGSGSNSGSSLIDASASPADQVRLTQSLALSPGAVLDTTVTHSSPDSDLNCLTKNQQFRLRKMQYSDQRQNAHSQVINPNNCVLWDHQTGYVFFTGIWRLYQDVMHGLIALDRCTEPAASENGLQARDRKSQCQKELDYVVTRSFYEKAFDVTSSEYVNRRKLAGRRGYRQHSQSSISGPAAAGTSGTSGSTAPPAVHYSDVHWHNLDQELKTRLCNIYRRTHQFFEEFEFQDLMKRIRGGYIKIQGTWLPYEVSRELCLRFCYPIRYLLVPIFGPDFPKECAQWYDRYVALYQRKPLSQQFEQKNNYTQLTSFTNLAPGPNTAPTLRTSDSLRPAKRSKVDVELLDASKNLLDISRRLSIQEPLIHSRFGQVPMPQFTRNRSHSWAPEYRESSRGSVEILPPIRPLLDSLEFSLHSSPNSSGYSEMNSPIKEPRTGPASPHSYIGYNSLPCANQVFTSPEDPHFLMMHSPSYFHDSRANPASLSNIAYFYNSHGHRYSYPGGMQVMFHPSMNGQEQPRDSRAGSYQVGVQP